MHCYWAKYPNSHKISFFLNQRAANTGWGAEEDRPSKWVQDKFQNPRTDRRSGRPNHSMGSSRLGPGGSDDYQHSEGKDNNGRAELNAKDDERRGVKTQWEQNSNVTKHKDTCDGSSIDRKRSSCSEPNSKEERDWRNEKRPRKYESESHHREDKYSREKDNRSGRDRDPSRHHHRRDKDERDR